LSSQNDCGTPSVNEPVSAVKVENPNGTEATVKVPPIKDAKLRELDWALITFDEKSQPELHHLLKQNIELGRIHKKLAKYQGCMKSWFMADHDKEAVARMLNDAESLSCRLSDGGKLILKPLLATIPKLQLDHFELLHDRRRLLLFLNKYSKLRSTNVHSSKTMLTLLYQHFMGSTDFGKFIIPTRVFRKGMEKSSLLFETILNEVTHKNVLVLVPLWQFKTMLKSVSKKFSGHSKIVVDYLYKIAVHRTGVQLSAKGKKFLSKNMPATKPQVYKLIEKTLKNIATPEATTEACPANLLRNGFFQLLEVICGDFRTENLEVKIIIVGI